MVIKTNEGIISVFKYKNQWTFNIRCPNTENLIYNDHKYQHITKHSALEKAVNILIEKQHYDY